MHRSWFPFFQSNPRRSSVKSLHLDEQDVSWSRISTMRTQSHTSTPHTKTNTFVRGRTFACDTQHKVTQINFMHTAGPAMILLLSGFCQLTLASNATSPTSGIDTILHRRKASRQRNGEYSAYIIAGIFALFFIVIVLSLCQASFERRKHNEEILEDGKNNRGDAPETS